MLYKVFSIRSSVFYHAASWNMPWCMHLWCGSQRNMHVQGARPISREVQKNSTQPTAEQPAAGEHCSAQLLACGSSNRSYSAGSLLEAACSASEEDVKLHLYSSVLLRACHLPAQAALSEST